MSKITRVFQQIFGGSADSSQFEQFGSDAEGSAVKTKDLPTIQEGAAWPEGWYAACDSGDQPPRIEDFNALFLLITTQLAYLLQEGIAEYDASTPYYYGSLCQISGVIYRSILDPTGATANTGNNPATDEGTNWIPLLSPSNFSGLGSNWIASLGADAHNGAENGIDSKTVGGNLPSAFLGASAQAADSANLGGEPPSAYLGATAQATDSAKLGGNLPSAFLGATAQASDSAKFSGYTLNFVNKQFNVNGSSQAWPLDAISAGTINFITTTNIGSGSDDMATLPGSGGSYFVLPYSGKSGLLVGGDPCCPMGEGALVIRIS